MVVFRTLWLCEEYYIQRISGHFGENDDFVPLYFDYPPFNTEILRVARGFFHSDGSLFKGRNNRGMVLKYLKLTFASRYLDQFYFPFKKGFIGCNDF
jgi:hypothetical protein